MLSIRLSANRFAFKPMDERLTDVMDGITDGMETLAEGDAALGFARLATAGLRVMLPEKNQSSVAMDLVLRSTRKALERFAAHVPGGQKDISFKKEVNARVFECNAYTINMDFFLRPGDSTIAGEILEYLEQLLEETVEDSEPLRRELRRVWPRYFSHAVEREYAGNLDKYAPLFKKLKTPMGKYNRLLEAKQAAEEQLLKFDGEEVFGEKNAPLEKVYIPLLAQNQTAAWMACRYEAFTGDVDLDHFLDQWCTAAPAEDAAQMQQLSWEEKMLCQTLNRKGLCVIHGEPGSGKSTVLKKLAVRLVREHVQVVFVRLKDVGLVWGRSCCGRLEDYIREKAPWIHLKSAEGTEHGSSTVVILDGLDEITGDVWDLAKSLLTELNGQPWDRSVRVILSGRTQLITACAKELSLTSVYAIRSLKYPQKIQLWEKLQRVFRIDLELEQVCARPHLEELLDKPLLMFLVAWCHTYSSRSVLEIADASELYETILQCLYYRRHGNQFYQPHGYRDYREMLGILGRVAQRHNSNDARIEEVKLYAQEHNKRPLFEAWIRHEEITQSRLLLAFFGVADPENMVISFYHRSFVEFLAVENMTQQLLELSGVEDDENLLRDCLNGMFRDYHLFSGKDPHILSLWQGKLRELHQDQKKWEGLMRNISRSLCTISRPDIREETRENVVSAALGLLDWLSAHGQPMCFYRWGNMLDIKEFAGRALPVLKLDGGPNLMTCDFSDADLAGLQNESVAWIGTCYFNSAAIGAFSLLGRGILERTQFYFARIGTLRLENIQVKKCRFDGAEVKACLCSKSRVKDSSFRLAKLEKADFRGTEFVACDFSQADLSGMELDGNARFVRCVMKGTRLRGVKMKYLTLENRDTAAMLREADLEGADWEETEDRRPCLEGLWREMEAEEREKLE